jgi:hypothetical protein
MRAPVRGAVPHSADSAVEMGIVRQLAASEGACTEGLSGLAIACAMTFQQLPSTVREGEERHALFVVEGDRRNCDVHAPGHASHDRYRVVCRGRATPERRLLRAVFANDQQNLRQSP